MANIDQQTSGEQGNLYKPTAKPAKMTKDFRDAVQEALEESDGPRSFFYSGEHNLEDRERAFWYDGDDENPRGWWYEESEK